MQVGKFAVSDVFDVNTYANDPRTQFLNKALTNNAAYDFAQETRGYDFGLSAAWINPTFAVRLGTFAMPTAAGGPDLAYNLNHQHSEQIEFEIHRQLFRAPRPPLILRVLAFRNVGDMGSYGDALAQVRSGPDVDAVRKVGSVKYGFGLNFEQALADGGDTGIFGRFGWNNGVTESFVFTEADQTITLGGQLSGAHWKRKDDRVGLAFVQNDISPVHQRYLAAGGLGLSVGDGALNYGSERALEAYYSYKIRKGLHSSIDYQFVANPGYNQDRGPVSVVSLRVHYLF